MSLVLKCVPDFAKIYSGCIDGHMGPLHALAFPSPGKILYETLYNVQVPVSEMKLAFVHI